MIRHGESRGLILHGHPVFGIGRHGPQPQGVRSSDGRTATARSNEPNLLRHNDK